MRYSYMENSYLKELITKVISVKDNKYVVLEDTIFYPNSGGQPHDTGKLIRLSDNKEFEVIYAGKFNDKISHEVINPGLKEGDEVICIIDWDRRYYMMRAHTSCHVLCSVLFNEAEARISGNQISEEKCRVDFNLENYDAEKMKEYVSKANNILKEEHNVQISYINRDEAEKYPELAKLANGLIQGVEELRVVEIEGVDIQCDGGTHVKNTTEVGQIEFLKSDNKGKSNRRVYYKVN